MKHLLLLHGAIGAMDQMQPIATALADRFIVHRIDFSGHGKKAPSATGISIELFEADVIRYLRQNEIEKIAVFGYSMGGYVGMYLAGKYPEIITEVITLATKFIWSPDIAANEIKLLDPETIKQKLPLFVAQLEQRHGKGNWVQLLQNTQQFLIGLGNNNLLDKDNLSLIQTRCLLMTGDRDKMVGINETKEIYACLSNGSLAVLPSTPHPIEKCNVNLLAFMIHQFLNQ